MKKFFYSLLVVSFLAINLSAKAYIEFDYMRGSGDFDTKINNIITSVSEDIDAYGFSLGYINPYNNRIEFRYTTHSIDGKKLYGDYDSYGFSYIHTIDIDSKITPYFEAGAGALNADNADGYQFSLGGGIFYSINPAIEVGAGYLYERNKFDVDNINEDFININNNLKLDIKYSF